MMTITIMQDGVWAGTGQLRGGVIEDCAALLGPAGLDHATGAQQEASEMAYAAIEQSIVAGQAECVCDGHRYTWVIE